MAGPIYLADAEGARIAELEGLTLLFQPASGLTHILAPPSPEILAALAAAPVDADGLAARLRERFDLPPGDGAETLAARLAELEAIGLVRRA